MYRRIRRSPVHNQFYMVKVIHRHKGEREGRECKHCGANFGGITSTNLFNHLKRFHKKIYEEVKLKDDQLKAELMIDNQFLDKDKIVNNAEEHKNSLQENPSKFKYENPSKFKYEFKSETSSLI